MLSRAQEARVREVLGSHAPRPSPAYCLEHLAATAQIPAGHLADLAAFVRRLRVYGACQTSYGGICSSDGQPTKRLLNGRVNLSGLLQIPTINSKPRGPVAFGPLTDASSYVAVLRRVSPARPSSLRDPDRAVRVVIADDDVEVRTLIGFILQQDPAVLLVGEAEDGESAIILVRQARPDLVVMDVMMPGVGGLEATRRIKRESPDTRVLVLTNLTDDETRRSAFLNGADSFITKRDITTRLLAAIKDTI